MDIRREKQIIAAIAKEFQNQNNTLKIPVPADEVEQTAVDLADSLSMKLFIHSGRNGEAAFIGRRKICLKLKQELGGSIKRRGVYTVWSGINRANRALDIINAVLQEEIDATRKRTDNPAAIQTPPDNRRCLFF